jgi:hypothetical protein
MKLVVEEACGQSNELIATRQFIFDWGNKHTIAIERISIEGSLIAIVERCCDRWGRTGGGNKSKRAADLGSTCLSAALIRNGC